MTKALCGRPHGERRPTTPDLVHSQRTAPEGSYSRGLPPLASRTLRHICIPSSFIPGSTEAFSLRLLWLQDYLHVCADPPDLLQEPFKGGGGDEVQRSLHFLCFSLLLMLLQ